MRRAIIVEMTIGIKAEAKVKVDVEAVVAEEENKKHLSSMRQTKSLKRNFIQNKYCSLIVEHFHSLAILAFNTFPAS